MLLKNFYTIESIQPLNDKHIRASIRLNATHAVYEGHFPEQPVVPGVCQIQIVKELAEDMLETEGMLERISQVKFLSVIDPHITPRLIVDCQLIPTENQSVYQLKGIISSDDRNFLNIKAQFTTISVPATIPLQVSEVNA